jgi:hypothetical protein
VTGITAKSNSRERAIRARANWTFTQHSTTAIEMPIFAGPIAIAKVPETVTANGQRLNACSDSELDIWIAAKR